MSACCLLSFDLSCIARLILTHSKVIYVNRILHKPLADQRQHAAPPAGGQIDPSCLSLYCICVYIFVPCLQKHIKTYMQCTVSFQDCYPLTLVMLEH